MRYGATVRTYALSTSDLDVARLWARLESILAYRRRRLEGTGPAHHRVEQQ